MTPWIKVRSDLHEQREVLIIARELAIPPLHAAGAMMRLWAWADNQTSDGSIPGVAAAEIDTLVNLPGFAAAVQKAGWLALDTNGVIIPNYTRHNGKSAKRRMLDAERQAHHRANTPSSP